MVRGLENFREWFRGYENQYVIIGGTACDLLMAEEELDFRAKHKNDIFRLTELLDRNMSPLAYLPNAIRADISEFIERMQSEDVDLKQIGIRDKSKEAILDELNTIYSKSGAQ